MLWHTKNVAYSVTFSRYECCTSRWNAGREKRDVAEVFADLSQVEHRLTVLFAVEFPEAAQPSEVLRPDVRRGLELDGPGLRAAFEDEVCLGAVLGAIAAEPDVLVPGRGFVEYLVEDQVLEEGSDPSRPGSSPGAR